MKLNKIKLAMISAGLLLSYTAHAQNTNTNTGTDSAVAGVYDTNFTSGEPVASTLSTDGSAKIRTRESSTGSYSTATGNTFTVPPSTSTVYSGVSSTATIDGRTVRYYDAGSSSLGANIDNTAIGDGARAGYGVQRTRILL